MQLKSRSHRYATYIALALIAVVVVISASGASSLLGAKNGTKPGVAGGQLEAGLNRALGKGVKRSNLGAILAPANSALWGAWVAPVNGQTSAQAVAALETQMGRPLDIVHQYEAFDETWPNATQTSWADGGRILLANISARQKSGSILTWTAIANGSNDSTIDALAGRLKTFGHQVYISFDEEPESRYHDDPATFTLASFVAAFRHLHDRMAANGVTNVSWVWNVTGYIGNASIYPSLYPGDSYVDWIAWDPYNWYNCSVNTTNKWESFDTVIQPFYDWVAGGHLSSGAATKPLMLAEYGSVENSGSPTKGQWFTDAVSTLPSRPLLKAVVYYDENKDCNWPITTSQSSTSGFAAASLNCYVYSGGPCTLTATSTASYDMTKAPTTWVAGQAQTFPVTVTNTGTSTWPSTGYNKVDLDLHFTTQSGGSSKIASWLNSSAFSLPADLAPGATVTLTVSFTAPSRTGPLILEAEMIKEQTFWFQQWQPVSVTVAAAVWTAAYNLAGVPYSWTHGRSQNVTVIIYNLGNITWPRSGTYRVDLNIHFTTVPGGSTKMAYWVTSQTYALAHSLPPGANATMTFSVLAPSGRGRMYLEVEMKKEHQFWFKKAAATRVIVR